MWYNDKKHLEGKPMTNKKPLPMLLAGIAMILYPILTFAISLVSGIINLIELIKFAAISTDMLSILRYLLGYVGVGIWCLLLSIVGIVFIITFIKPGKVLYCISFALLGALGIAYGLLGIVSDATLLLSNIESIQYCIENQYWFSVITTLSNLFGATFIHTLAAILISVLAFISLTPKAGKVISKFWIIPTVLSAVECLFYVVFTVGVRILLGVNVVGALVGGMFAIMYVGFTACILLAGLGMSSMVKKNFGKSAE